ncbi:MAG TPA: hypothetical protein VND65_20395 [Candidatus Binatia bacterium]|nr:hypothetical protein [Candidatus Binatia bacterium]
MSSRPEGYIESVIPSDTSPEAARVQLEIYRRMTPAERLRMALEMSDSIRNVAMAGLRSRHPDWGEKELRQELMRIMYGWTPGP